MFRSLSWRFFFRPLLEDIPFEEVVDELKDFDERFVIILRKHLALLAWWCAINVVTGVPLLLLTDDHWWYFALMNICWASINFGIVLWIFNHVFYQRFTKGDTFQRYKVQRHVEKMLLLNIGLDSAYVFAGLYLHTLSRVPEISYPELWLGFGWSVIIQGAFLFCHDNIFHYLHRKNFRLAQGFLASKLKRRVAVS